MRSPKLRPQTLVFALMLAAVPAAGAPTLRYQADLRGDVAVFGSTLAFDCGASVPAPAGAIASCAGQTNIADTAPDLYWRDAIADSSITPTQARTSATLELPDGAVIKYARLYWSAIKPGAAPDSTATLDWFGGPQVEITADKSWVIPAQLTQHPDWYYYQSTGDATDFVAEWGAGDFRVTDVEAIPLANTTYDIDRGFSAWTLVVFYELDGDDLRNLALFDGFEWVDPGLGQPAVSVDLTGFLVPDGFTAKMAAFMYEGDFKYTGDRFLVNGTPVTNGVNPVDNFFNSSRTYLGTPVSGALDVPRLSGQPDSMAGYDLDTIDVTSALQVGDTSATVGADSSLDIFMLGGFVTSITSLSPNFGAFTKTVVDENGGAVLPGDILEYTITFTNSGNDPSVRTVLTDQLDPGLTLVPGSIRIVSGGAAGAKTDAAGDDEAEYVASTRTITVRLGAGADATHGGSVAVGASAEVRFRATVAAQTGAIPNTAVLKASGQSGGSEKTYRSDGDATALGEQPTIIVVNECQSDANCPAPRPHCDPDTHTCIGCRTDADCPEPARPACQPSGACGECSTTNATLCVGEEPVCDARSGTCVLCTLGQDGDASACVHDADGPSCVAGPNNTVHCGCFDDSECGDAASARVCDYTDQVCISGCRGEGGNGCPDGEVCSSTDTTIGTCVPAPADGGVQDDGGATPDGGGTVLPGSPSSGCGCAAAPPAGSLLAALGALLAVCWRRRRHG
ncbi:MAG TPA: isopeptide-forming domain-containing fimbrial protein [Polyangia bacterium]|jgi:uncharacterized repeat protein (TIGR01451 family)/MYXO-CTERM domain-containing protein